MGTHTLDRQPGGLLKRRLMGPGTPSGLRGRFAAFLLWLIRRRTKRLGGRQSMRAVLVVFALLATSFKLHAQVCDSPTRIRVLLTSSTLMYQARTRSGYVVRVVRDVPGWEVQVFRSTDRRGRDNLLYPIENWHGAFPCQIQPGTEDIFQNTRRVAVRSTPHSVANMTRFDTMA
jgi:hypothetical protein